MTSASNAFSDRISEAVRDLYDRGAGADTLEGLVELARDSVTAAEHAGLSMREAGGKVVTVAATSELVVRADAWQYELGEGPCLDAVQEQEIVLSTDLREDSRWPRWAAEVAGLGVRSLLSLQLFTGERTLGALNLYGTHPQAFGQDSLVEGAAVAAHVSVVLAATRREENLQLALASRTTIGRAEGILMERFGIDATAAFSVLQRISQDRNVRLLRVAEQLVETRLTPGVEGGPPRPPAAS